jgi:hypothetical protein
MKTRILQDIACVHGVFRRGQVLLLAADVAQPLIDVGFAEIVCDQPDSALLHRRPARIAGGFSAPGGAS